MVVQLEGLGMAGEGPVAVTFAFFGFCAVVENGRLIKHLSMYPN
jgi:hypothetical protein